MHSTMLRWLGPAALLFAFVSRAAAQGEAWPPSVPGEKPYAAVLSQLPDPAPFAVTLEAALLKPRLDGRARSLSRVNTAAQAPVSLPAAELDWALSPKLTVEGLLDPGLGSVLASYRYLTSSGDGTLPELRQRGALVQSARSLRTELNVNEGVFAYRSPSLLPGEAQRLYVGGGLRVADVFFKSEALGSPELISSVGNFFIGAGPVLFGEYRAQVLGSPLWLHAGASGGPLFGQVRQRFWQRFQARTVTTSRLLGAWASRNAGTLGAELGLTLQVEVNGRPVLITAAYSLEQWFHIGQYGPSDSDLILQGALLRAEIRF